MPILRRRLLTWLAAASASVLVSEMARGKEKSMLAFRTEILDILRRRFPDTPAEPGDEDATIKLGPAALYLGNLYAHVRELSADERDAAILDFLQRTVQSLAAAKETDRAVETWAGAQSLLRPRLSAADYLKTAPQLIHRDFAPDVIVTYVIDEGPQVRFVNADMFGKWGVGADALEAAAIANLEALSKDIPVEPQGPRSGSGSFVAIATRDSYDATRLLLPRFRARLLAALGEPAFAGIPNRDFLVAWSRGYSHHAEFVAQIAKDVGRRPYPLTDAIFVIAKDGVRPATAAERRGG